MDGRGKNEENRRRIAWLNAGTAVLVCLILLFSWLFAKHLFDHAREQMNYYLYQSYLSSMSNGFGRAQRPQRQQATQTGLQGLPAPQRSRPSPQAAYEFKSPLNPALLGAHSLMIFVCWMGTYYLGNRKRELKGQMIYTDIRRE